MSDYPSLTLAAAQRVHEADIIAFAIGVGTSLDMAELTAIASTPTCTYLVLLELGFNELDSIVLVIEKMACEGKRIVCDAIANTPSNRNTPSLVDRHCVLQPAPFNSICESHPVCTILDKQR